MKTIKTKIYKSHKIQKGAYWKIQYAIKNLEQNTITTIDTIIVENIGGAKKSLDNYFA